MASLTFLGAARTVTGSKYLLEVDGHRILVDCGLFQGLADLRRRNWAAFPVDPASIEAVILTHAHIDHSGLLPRLVSNGFRRAIYCTHGTSDLCSLVLPDAGRLQEEDAKLANRRRFSKHSPALPLFTEADALAALTHIRTGAVRHESGGRSWFACRIHQRGAPARLRLRADFAHNRCRCAAALRRRSGTLRPANPAGSAAGA